MNFTPAKRVASYAAVFSIALIVATPALATNGYFLIGYGSKARAMGGASVAIGHDAMSAAAKSGDLFRSGYRDDANRSCWRVVYSSSFGHA